jgi:hypothetical protein
MSHIPLARLDTLLGNESNGTLRLFDLLLFRSLVQKSAREITGPRAIL